MIPGSANPLLLRSAAAAETGISRSLRFNSSDSAYLSRTPASAGNRKTWTWAGWVKRSNTDSDGAIIFSSSPSAGANTYICFAGSNSTGTTADGISFFSVPLSVNVGTAGVFRDFSAWFHLVVAVDTTQGTAANRVKIYINGTEATYGSTSYPTSSQDLGINAAFSHTIGTTNSLDSWAYFNGYLADIYFIDGQALTPSSFTETDATTGQLVEKAYTGSYGTNGFHLDFADNASTTTIGYDAAGSNDWTANNLSVTAGAGNDSLVDVPTNGAQTDTGVGGEVRGNYCTLNPNYSFSTHALSNGNLEVSRASGAGFRPVRSTIGASTGKWYFEFTSTTANQFAYAGIMDQQDPFNFVDGNVGIGDSAISYGCYFYSGNKRNNNSETSYGSAFASGDVMGVAVDLDNGKIWFSKNGTWFASGDPVAGTNAAYTGLSGTKIPAVSAYDTNKIICNFGQRSWAYAAPSGFKALNTANLPSTTITTSGTYTGNGVADGPFVYLNGVPTAMTVEGNAVTFGTHADKLSNGFKIRTTSTTYNQNALDYDYTITTTGDPFKYARAQANP